MTLKQKITEQWIDAFIAKYGYPPTYKQIGIGVGISTTAAYERCRHFRDKLNGKALREMMKENTTHVKLQFHVPNAQMPEFLEWLQQMNMFLDKSNLKDNETD
jgi:hypothetical protein